MSGESNFFAYTGNVSEQKKKENNANATSSGPCSENYYGWLSDKKFRYNFI